MNKIIIALFASFLFSPFAYSVSEPEIPNPTDPGTSKPHPSNELAHIERLIAEKKEWAERNRFSEEESGPNSPLGQALARNEREIKELEARLESLTNRPEIERPKPFPPHWGEPPAAQTKDMRPLPGGFGMGSSTLARWIGENLAKDKADGKDPEKPEVGRPEPKPHFPAHWGRPPEIQLTDHVELPAGFGMGSSTMAHWIKENIAQDKISEFRHLEKEIAEKKEWAERNRFSEEESGPNSPLGQALARNERELRGLESRLNELKKVPEVAKWGKPEVLTDKEKLDPRKFEGEVLKQVKEGKLSQEDARKKLDSLRGEMEKRGEFKRPKRPQKPELSSEVKNKLKDIKDMQDALAKEMKTKLDGLKKDGATREEMREAVHAFQKDNKNRLEDIRDLHKAIHDKIKEARPPKPERPELTADIKAKVEVLKEKQKELHTARKDLHENLKDKSKEDREALIADFKEANKAKHEEIKTKAKEVKEEIRALVETEATRTSDL